jgi:hypothetical protein
MLQAGWGAARAARMERFLKHFVLFTGDSDLCTVWAQVVDSERKQGRIISTQDACIGATAILNVISPPNYPTLVGVVRRAYFIVGFSRCLCAP